LYCLDRLDEHEAAPIEEHLLVCESCQQRVTDLDLFLKAARRATRDLRREEKYSTSPATGWGWMFRPGWVVAGALAVLMVAVLPMLRGPSELQTLDVSAYRGDQETGAGVAEAGKPLRLNLDLTGVESANCCVLELVSSEGEVLHESTATVSGGRATLVHASGLRAGQYWIRVRSNDGADLREFGLAVR
jgi:hypothetical protein